MYVKNIALPGMLAIYILLFACFFFSGYLLGDATFWIGLSLVPYVLATATNKQKSLRFLPMVVLLLLLSFSMQVQSIRYFLVMASVIFLIESLRGKLGPLLLWLLLIISPLFYYVSEIFTFPIRLALSEWTGVILRLAGLKAEISGNIIQMNKLDFSVDPACMGLQMMGFSVLIAIFLITHNQRLTKSELNPLLSVFIITIAFGLNIFSNLTRILILVIFQVLPTDPMHEIVGLSSLVVYVFLPLSFLVKYLFGRYAVKIQENQTDEKLCLPAIPGINLALLIVCNFLVFRKSEPKIFSHTSDIVQVKEKYRISDLHNGIIQYSNYDVLVYSKSIPAFYSTEHSPYICWKGSGYAFVSITENEIAGKRVYFGTLVKGKEKLQTAWWFSNNRHLTISQLDWRWRVLCGEPGFSLINVTADNKANLNAAIKEWL